MPQAEMFEEVYTRKVGGENYHYRLEYTPGEVVEWRAQVFRAGILMGTPSGVLSDNTLAGPELQQNLVTLVEVTIEQMLGIDE